MRRFFWLLLLSGGLITCKTSGSAAGQHVRLPAGKAAPSQIVRLPYQKATTLPTTGGRVQATLTEVDDSRCPQGTTCVWAGKVTVSLAVTDAATTRTLRFTIAPQQVDSTQLTLNKKAYWLRLLGVTPYPSDTNGGEAKVATVRLRPA